MTVRTVISSSGGAETADLTVYTENGEGDAVTGAVVLAETNSGSVSRIAFDPETYSYNSKAEISSDGVFNFSVQSSLLKNKIKYSITHIQLKSAPCITIFRDEEGKSVLEGERVSALEDIQIAWNSVYSGTVYKVSIKTALLTIYSVSTKALQVTVPAAVFRQTFAMQYFCGFVCMFSYHACSPVVIRTIVLNFLLQVLMKTGHITQIHRYYYQ
ncbi:MAG: hypothetical protein M0P01_12380 [Treponema sp.]|nr:hypothetical protein [Treponema sp.]